ncbi:hypothetical protein LINPERPRIM_LOCUS8685 [Linum perenne]
MGYAARRPGPSASGRSVVAGLFVERRGGTHFGSRQVALWKHPHSDG